MKPALRKVATVTRTTVDGKSITAPEHIIHPERRLTVPTMGRPIVSGYMQGHRAMISPMPFLRPKVTP